MCVSNVRPSLHHFCRSCDVMKDGRLRHTFGSSPPSFKYGFSYAISSKTPAFLGQRDKDVMVSPTQTHTSANWALYTVLTYAHRMTLTGQISR